MKVSRTVTISWRHQLALATALLVVPVAVVIGATHLPPTNGTPQAALNAYLNLHGQKQGEIKGNVKRELKPPPPSRVLRVIERHLEVFLSPPTRHQTPPTGTQTPPTGTQNQ
jgi:hypothetical protein